MYKGYINDIITSPFISFTPMFKMFLIDIFAIDHERILVFLLRRCLYIWKKSDVILYRSFINIATLLFNE